MSARLRLTPDSDSGDRFSALYSTAYTNPQVINDGTFSTRALYLMALSAHHLSKDMGSLQEEIIQRRSRLSPQANVATEEDIQFIRSSLDRCRDEMAWMTAYLEGLDAASNMRERDKASNPIARAMRKSLGWEAPSLGKMSNTSYFNSTTLNSSINEGKG